MKKPRDKLFVIRKYVLASSCQDALKKEKDIKPDDCYIQDDYLKKQAELLPSAIGFTINNNEE